MGAFSGSECERPTAGKVRNKGSGQEFQTPFGSGFGAPDRIAKQARWPRVEERSETCALVEGLVGCMVRLPVREHCDRTGRSCCALVIAER